MTAEPIPDKLSPFFRISPPSPVEEEGGGELTHVLFETNRLRGCQKNADSSRQCLVIGRAFFAPRPIFDPVMRGQMSHFRVIKNFS